MLTMEDRLAICDLYARYNHAIDTGNTTAWVELFSRDGVLSARQPIVGHHALRRYSEERLKAADRNPHFAIQHWNNNLCLELSGDHVEGSCYFLLTAVNRATNAYEIIAMGRYRDKLVMIDGKWRFAQRAVTFAE